MRDQLEPLVIRLIAISEEIALLDLEVESDSARLDSLQKEQLEIKDTLEASLSPEDRANGKLRALFEQSYETELSVNHKLKEYQSFISSQLSKIQEGNRMKSAYYHAYSQPEGYFVDSKK
jgi:CO dehydrogenase/acetyl-CoA synthase delta subunit